MADSEFRYARPQVCFQLLRDALRHLEEEPDIRPALVALDRLLVAMRKSGWENFPILMIERVRHARASVDDNPDTAYQELRSVMDSWLQRWPAK